MALPSLVYDYHEGVIVKIRLGPRREVNLSVAMQFVDPWPTRFSERPIVHVRFGGITNYDEVRDFFGGDYDFFDPARKAPQVLRPMINNLDYDRGEISKIDRLAFRLALDGYLPIIIRCRNLTIRADTPGVLPRG